MASQTFRRKIASAVETSMARRHPRRELESVRSDNSGDRFRRRIHFHLENFPKRKFEFGEKCQRTSGRCGMHRLDQMESKLFHFSIIFMGRNNQNGKYILNKSLNGCNPIVDCLARSFLNNKTFFLRS